MLQANDKVIESRDRGSLAKMIMQLFSLWDLSSEDSLALLGMSPDNRSALSRYRQGKPLASNRDLLERVGHLLAIHKNLRLLFPHERDKAYGWVKRRNRAFDGMTPIEAIREYGFAGILMVRAYLDRVRGA
ncbi:MAG: MbcA/ParS/Xre antitoxin family protein [Gammaproteobacteria bacterium]|jgi:hypothetical protein|nr:MbcA/ParS/Xre antitoxin family protein [Gammaproteobacteria bacterium]